MLVQVYDAVKAKYGHDRASSVVVTMLTQSFSGEIHNPVAWGMKLAKWDNEPRRHYNHRELSLTVDVGAPNRTDVQLDAKLTLEYLLTNARPIVQALLSGVSNGRPLTRQRRHFLRSHLRKLLARRESHG